MNGKTSLVVIILAFVLPVVLYMAMKSPQESMSGAAVAEAAGKPKVLWFSQLMCSECKKLKGIMQPIEPEYKDRVVFVHIDVADGRQETSALMRQYGVNVVPTLVFIKKDGTVLKVTEGALPAGQLKGYLDSIINE